MNNQYSILKKGAFVTDEYGLHRIYEPVTEELLRLENEEEILLDLLDKKKEALKKGKSPKKIKKIGKILWAIITLIGPVAIIVVSLPSMITVQKFNFSEAYLHSLKQAILHSTIYTGIFGAFVYRNFAKKALKRQSEIDAIKEEIPYLEEELSAVRKKKSEAENRKVQGINMSGQIKSLEAHDLFYTEKMEERLHIIRVLKAFREEALKRYREGTFEQFLKDHAIRPETIKEEQGFISKRISMLPKDKPKRKN